MNVVFAWVAFVFLARKNGSRSIRSPGSAPVTVDSLPPGAEALAAMHPGDSIVAIDDQPVHSWNEVQELIGSGSGDSVVVHLAERASTADSHSSRSTGGSGAGPERSSRRPHQPLVETVESGRPGPQGRLAPGRHDPGAQRFAGRVA
jgi:membrane-associated protease RseP (regulator of RpoE activity)